MNDAFTLPDSLSLSDLATYLGRAGRVEDGSVRLIAGSGVLAVYVAVFYPMGLLDSSPTVLGLRTFQLDDRPEFVSTPLEVLAWADTPTTPDDPLWTASPEGRRAFVNTADYLAARGLK